VFELNADACLHGSGHTSEGRGFFPPPHLDLSCLEGGGRRRSFRRFLLEEAFGALLKRR
jgi:hypothetical protein